VNNIKKLFLFYFFIKRSNNLLFLSTESVIRNLNLIHRKDILDKNFNNITVCFTDVLKHLDKTLV